MAGAHASMARSKRAGKAALAKAKEATMEGEEAPKPAVSIEPSSGPEQNHPRVCLSKLLRNTKLCAYYRRGACQFGDKCSFAHSANEVQTAPDLRKTCLCKASKTGKCSDLNCGFAHGMEELRSTGMFYKTMPCAWHLKGKCRNGDACRFAHGAKEQRARAVAWVDPPPSPSVTATPAAEFEVGTHFQVSGAALAQPSVVEPLLVQPTSILGAAAPHVFAGRGANNAFFPPWSFMREVHPASDSSSSGMSEASASRCIDSRGPTVVEKLAPVIERVLETSQHQLNTLTHHGVDVHGAAAQADLMQLSQSILAVTQQLNLIEVQMKHHLAARIDHLSMDYGFNPSLKSAFGDDPNIMGA